jgi:hypothetical protein
MNKDDLCTFLIDANKHTYATGNESLQKKETDGSTTITYQKGIWSIHDNFFGGEPYGGREVVFYKNKPVWIMVYYGYIESDVAPETVYPTLQNALRHMPEKNPFRGPERFQDGVYTYHNASIGNIEKFSGEEIIVVNNRKIYQARYIGGFIDRKR